MATYERSTHVDATFDDVWEFHSTVAGLRAVTPSWFDLEVEAVEAPDGGPEPAELLAGTELTLSMRPLGVGPRQRWRTEIVARERDEDSGYFRDAMTDGPFRPWTHTHAFFADGDGTKLLDRVEYETPAGRYLDPLGAPFFELMFRHRHRRTRELLEARS